MHNSVAPFISLSKLHEFGAGKPISLAKPADFDFFAINFTACSHVLSTAGDALSCQDSGPVNIANSMGIHLEEKGKQYSTKWIFPIITNVATSQKRKEKKT